MAWARAGGFARLELGVTVGNEPATRLYEGAGFVATRDRRPLPSNPQREVVRMTLAL